jgi:DNA-binding IclR family transcriptional regulator
MLARSVEAGYGLNRDDVLPGISSVGVGLALPPPWTHASVLASGATESMPDAHLPRVLSVVTAAANRFRALIPDAF